MMGFPLKRSRSEILHWNDVLIYTTQNQEMQSLQKNGTGNEVIEGNIEHGLLNRVQLKSVYYFTLK